jgi:hypothetical protein
MCSFLLALPKLRVLSIKRCLWLKTDLYEKIVRDASCTLVECDFTGSGGIGRNRGSWTCKFNRSMVPYHPLLDPQASITMALVMDSAPPGAQPFAFFINQTPRGYTATKPLSPELSRKKLEYNKCLRCPLTKPATADLALAHLLQSVRLEFPINFVARRRWARSILWTLGWAAKHWGLQCCRNSCLAEELTYQPLSGSGEAQR